MAPCGTLALLAVGGASAVLLQPEWEIPPIRRFQADDKRVVMAHTNYSVCSPKRVEEDMNECGPCWMRGNQAPRLYVRERSDGCGSRLHALLASMAVASKNGMNLGGVISKGVCQESHGADVFRAVGAMFGVQNPTVMFTENPPKFDLEYRGIADMERRLQADLRKVGKTTGGRVFLEQDCVNCEMNACARQQGMDAFLSPNFTSMLRRHVQVLPTMPLAFKPGRMSVAIHVRRGDVAPEGRFAVDWKMRSTPDSWYFELVNIIRKLMPRADIHVFSSTEKTYTSEDFDEYRKRGMTVHLDGDILEAWAHLARADFVVMAKSSFSHLPALYNDNCVIYQEYWNMPQVDWIVASQKGEKDDQPMVEVKKILECYVKLKQREKEKRSYQDVVLSHKSTRLERRLASRAKRMQRRLGRKAEREAKRDTP